MAILYVIGCLIILVINRAFLGETVRVILDAAFSPNAIGGGFVASSLMSAARYGIARGLFSNESGMGSAPIVAAAAKTRNPVRQALVSSTGTFWDTVVVCLMTGLVVVSSVIRNGHMEALNDGGKLTHAAFGQIPVLGVIVLTFGLFTFALSTILGWSYYGERGAEYLFGPKSNVPYRVIYVIFTFLGTTLTIGVVWDLADALNALMTIPNLIAILLLSPEVARLTRYYVYENRIDEVDDTPIPLRTDI
jgi:AGCS family alanine or glycine:cation symporter